MEEVQAWLKKVRFRKTLFGGVDEADVWKKISELNTLYENALAAERLRYDALLAEARGSRGGGRNGNFKVPENGLREVEESFGAGAAETAKADHVLTYNENSAVETGHGSPKSEPSAPGQHYGKSGPDNGQNTAPVNAGEVPR